MASERSEEVIVDGRRLVRHYREDGTLDRIVIAPAEAPPADPDREAETSEPSEPLKARAARTLKKLPKPRIPRPSRDRGEKPAPVDKDAARENLRESLRRLRKKGKAPESGDAGTATPKVPERRNLMERIQFPGEPEPEPRETESVRKAFERFRAQHTSARDAPAPGGDDPEVVEALADLEPRGPQLEEQDYGTATVPEPAPAKTDAPAEPEDPHVRLVPGDAEHPAKKIRFEALRREPLTPRSPPPVPEVPRAEPPKAEPKPEPEPEPAAPPTEASAAEPAAPEPRAAPEGGAPEADAPELEAEPEIMEEAPPVEPAPEPVKEAPEPAVEPAPQPEPEPQADTEPATEPDVDAEPSPPPETPVEPEPAPVAAPEPAPPEREGEAPEPAPAAEVEPEAEPEPAPQPFVVPEEVLASVDDRVDALTERARARRMERAPVEVPEFEPLPRSDLDERIERAIQTAAERASEPAPRAPVEVPEFEPLPREAWDDRLDAALRKYDERESAAS